MSVDYTYLSEQHQALLEVIPELEDGDTKDKLRDLAVWVDLVGAEGECTNLNAIDEVNSVANGAFVNNRGEEVSDMYFDPWLMVMIGVFLYLILSDNR